MTVAMRWTDRLIGLISTLILARLLVPADFGIIAMASLVIILADVFLDLGVNVALIQNNNATQEHYNTAWTLRLIQATIAATIVIVAAPWAAAYFNEPRVEWVIRCLSLGFFISALENIGVITFQKEMRFGLDFRFLFLRRMAGFIVTIAAALILQSYWALVIGNLVGRVLGVGLSYALHPMRPRLSLTKSREIFGISLWMMLRSASGYLDSKLHQIFVGGRENATVMGAYSLADEIATMPTTELLAPLNRVLFPAFVQVKEDLGELKRVFLLAQSIQVLIGVPAGVGLALVAQELVPILLGEKWLSAVPFIEIMALVSIMQAIMTSGGYILLTLGKARLVAIYSIGQVFIFAALAILAIPNEGALSIAWLRLLVAGFGLLTFFWLLINAFAGLRLAEMIVSFLRPLIAVAIMAAVIIYATPLAGLDGALLLGAKVLAGVASYALAIVALWWLAGRPPGAEAYVFDKIRAVAASRAKRDPV